MAWLGLKVPSWPSSSVWYAGSQLDASTLLHMASHPPGGWRSNSFPEFVPIYTLTGMMAKAEAAKDLLSASLRGCTASLLNLIGQSKSQGHPDLRGGKTDSIPLMGGTTAKSYCKEAWTQRSMIHGDYYHSNQPPRIDRDFWKHRSTNHNGKDGLTWT